MTAEDLPAVVVVQERGAVAGLAAIFPQETHPFPRDAVLDRWRTELEAQDVAAYLAVDELGAVTGFAARRRAAPPRHHRRHLEASPHIPFSSSSCSTGPPAAEAG